MLNSVRMYSKMIFRHPSLITYALTHPSFKDLRRRDRELDLLPIKLSAINKPEKSFLFNGEEFEYFYNDYNQTWCSERTVEVPIIWRIVQNYPSTATLEVGNVLSHYFPTKHTIVDKYELAPGVLNEDITDFNPSRKFDLIVSISTLEHIGWSTRHEERDPPKFFRAVDRLISLLTPMGKLWFTVPFGYNSYLDEAVRGNNLKTDRKYFLKRVSMDNRWKQCDYNEVTDARYGGFKIRYVDAAPFPRANAIMVVMISADSKG